ncbi:hypothetical protein FRB90_012280 [Tulasnella sp. 427]|nr:hypothetical protein FRB90_012280 [Tulasnella sp. 427]
MSLPLMNIDIHPSFPAHVPQDRRKGRVIGGQLPPPWLEFQGLEEWTYFCHPTLKVLTSADPRDVTNNAALRAVVHHILQTLPGRRAAAHMDIIIELSDGLEQAWYYLVDHRDRIVPLEIVEHITSDGGHSDHCINASSISKGSSDMPWTAWKAVEWHIWDGCSVKYTLSNTRASMVATQEEVLAVTASIPLLWFPPACTDQTGG